MAAGAKVSDNTELTALYFATLNFSFFYNVKVFAFVALVEDEFTSWVFDYLESIN